MTLGLMQMSTASVLGKVTTGMTTLEEVKRACDEYNKIGAITKAAGLQQITHHEGFENSRIEDGRLTFPVLLEYYDPELVKMQFQMSSMLTVGDPIMYFTNHPGRFASLHLQGVDVTRGVQPSRAGIPVPKPTPEQIAEAEAARAARQVARAAQAGAPAVPAAVAATPGWPLARTTSTGSRCSRRPRSAASRRISSSRTGT